MHMGLYGTMWNSLHLILRGMCPCDHFYRLGVLHLGVPLLRESIRDVELAQAPLRRPLAIGFFVILNHLFFVTPAVRPPAFLRVYEIIASALHTT